MKNISRVENISLYSSKLPNDRIPTQEKAISSIDSSTKKMLKSFVISTMIIIRGPNKDVSFSITSNLIQNKNVVRARSQSKWKVPVL